MGYDHVLKRTQTAGEDHLRRARHAQVDSHAFEIATNNRVVYQSREFSGSKNELNEPPSH